MSSMMDAGNDGDVRAAWEHWTDPCAKTTGSQVGWQEANKVPISDLGY
jgi:hypothetical protein